METNTYIKYREQEDLFELFDEKTNTSYWLELNELMNEITLKRVTRR